MAQKTDKGHRGGESIATKKRSSSQKASASTAKERTLTAIVAGPTLATARVDGVDGEHVRIVIGRQPVVALRDESLHPAVLRTAAKRGERVLVERGEDGVWTVIGALRTQPTPGIDVAESYTIEAERVTVRAHEDVTLVAEGTSVVLRGGEGEIESHAPRIVSRADGVHRIAGRELKLN